MKKKQKVTENKKANQREADPFPSPHQEEIKRLNRILGQIEGIKAMIEKSRELDAVLMQCKAVHQALKSVESRILRSHVEAAMDDCLSAPKKKDRVRKREALLALYKAV